MTGGCVSPEGSCSRGPRLRPHTRWGRPGSKPGLWEAPRPGRTGWPLRRSPPRPPPSSHTWAGGTSATVRELTLEVSYVFVCVCGGVEGRGGVGSWRFSSHESDVSVLWMMSRSLFSLFSLLNNLITAKGTWQHGSAGQPPDVCLMALTVS